MAAKGPQPGTGKKTGQKTSGGSGRRPGNTRTRPSKAVYRRRRMVLAVLALLVVAALAWAGVAIAAALSGDREPNNSEPFQTAPTASPGSAANADEPNADEKDKAEKPDAAEKPDKDAESKDGTCPPAAVKVEAATDAAAYPAGVNPLLTLSVTNTGSEPCKINVGTTQMEFVVTSGSDRIFSSADCQDGAEDLMKDFEPGATEKANFTWERLRSAPGCAAVASNPNPGWYVFTARLGETTSEKAVFQLD
ncbi:hypothetical protein ACWGQ2_10620 [Arthrobacter sp. NPDC055585]